MRDEDEGRDPFEGFSEEDAEGNRTYPLRYPVTIKIKVAGSEREERVETVTMRRARGDDLTAMERVDPTKGASALMRAIQLLTGLDQVTLGKLDTADIVPLGEAATTLLEGGRRTGVAI